MEQDKKLRSYIIVWTDDGFRELNETTRYEKQKTLEALGGMKAQDVIDLHSLVSWCLNNPISNPEIWEFQATVSREEILQYIKQAPEELKVSIQGNGRPLYRRYTG